MTRVDTLLTDHLDLWTSAIVRKSPAARGRSKKFSLYGVDKLRALILDLAVRGKLVLQAPEDEPASELLRQIKIAKTRLVAERKIKQPRDFTDGRGIQAAFPIPESWLWVRLDAVGAIVGGGTPPASDSENFAESGSGFPWLTPADLGGYSNLYIARGARDLSEQGLSRSSATVLPKNTVLFTSRAPIGYVAIASNPIATNQGFKSVVPYISELSRYIALALRAFAHEINENAPSTTFKEVSSKIVAAIPFPLPPLAEQHRIVAKVDELMTLCDQLEAGTYDAIEAHQLLVTELLATLTASRDADELADNWTRLEGHFDILFVTETSVDQLKETILQLAVMGKLVPPDANDRPSSELLKQIQKEKADYAAGHGIKPLQVQAIDADEPPFVVPHNWSWTRLSALFNVVTDGDHQAPPKANNGIAFLTIGNITTGELDFEDCRLVSAEYFRALPPYRTPAKGDILYTVVGATYGRPAPVDVDRPFCVQRHIAILKPAKSMNRRFLVQLLSSQLVYAQAAESITGTAQPTIPLRPLRNFLVPLPPLAQQERIVAKIDQLMALCDGLNAHLALRDQCRVDLSNAVFAEALG